MSASTSPRILDRLGSFSRIRADGDSEVGREAEVELVAGLEVGDATRAGRAEVAGRVAARTAVDEDDEAVVVLDVAADAEVEHAALDVGVEGRKLV